jgi:hypothetical protein
MNRAEHHAAAELLLARADGKAQPMAAQAVILAAAQVHATLASGVLAEGEPAPRSGGSYDQTARTLVEINDLRASLENAEQSRRLAEGLLRTARDQRDDLQDRIGRALAVTTAVGPVPGSPLDRIGVILEGPSRAEYNPQYQGTRSVAPDPFKHPCECLGAHNGRHERGVFVGCIYARHLSDGPGQ